MDVTDVSAPVSVRPRSPADDARIVEIYSAQEADSAPLTVERYREEHVEDAADQHREQWVAERDGQVVGSGGFHPAWWTGNPGVYSGEIRVDQRCWRQGTGTALYERLRSRLLERRATRLLGWVREDAASGRGFAARLGFRETGQIIEEYRLHVPDANDGAYAGIEERLRNKGLRIASLAELEPENEDFLRALQRLWDEFVDESAAEEDTGDSFEAWRRNVLQGAGLSADTHWIALDGERPVGTTFLKRLSERAADNDYTGVAPSHRGRGIAPALKLHAIAWAREHGVDWFYTSSEVGNAPMLTINRRLGYRPGARRIEVARDLP